jgi:phage-related protein
VNSALLRLILELQDSASAGLRQAQSAVQSLGSSMATLAAGGLVAGTVALGAFGAQSVQVAGDFEAGMNRLASVAGDSLGQAGFNLDDVRNKALLLGAETQFSAAQAQEAMINLAKGGVPVVDIMGQATDATLGLAAAGELELASAADIVSKQLGVWASEGVTAAQVADQMAQAANASTVDVEELALGLSQVGGVAKATGLDFNEVTQTMALLAPGFASAADAGTSLKTFLISMQPKSKAAAGAMRELGLITTDMTALASEFGLAWDGTGQTMAKINQLVYESVKANSSAREGTKAFDDAMTAFYADFEMNKFFDAQGAFVGMEEATRLLSTATAGLSEEQKSAALATIFGTDAFRAAAMLAEAGAEGYTAMGVAMQGAGTAAEQAATRNQGFKFALDSLLGSVETLQIIMGSALLPIFTSFINASLIPGVNWLSQFATAITSSTTPFQTFVAQVNAVIPGFAAFMAALTPVGAFLQANLMPILVGIGAVLGGALLAGIVSAAAAFLAFIAPLAALAAGIAILYAAWQSNMGGIQEITFTVLGAVQAFIQSVLIAIQAFWTAHGATILAGAQAVWMAIQLAIITVATLIHTTVVGIFTALQAFWTAHGATIVAATTAAWTLLSAIVTTAVQLVHGIVTAVLQVLQGDFSGAWDTIVETATTFGTNLTGVFEAAGTLLQTTTEGVIARIGEAWQTFVDGASSIGTAIIDGVKSGITSAADGLVRVVTEAAKRALEAAKSALGIKSPSSVFADQVGKQIPAGIDVGVQRAMPALERSLTSAVGRLPRKAADSMAQAAVTLPAAAPASPPMDATLAAMSDIDRSMVEAIGYIPQELAAKYRAALPKAAAETPRITPAPPPGGASGGGTRAASQRLEVVLTVNVNGSGQASDPAVLREFRRVATEAAEAVIGKYVTQGDRLARNGGV